MMVKGIEKIIKVGLKEVKLEVLSKNRVCVMYKNESRPSVIPRYTVFCVKVVKKWDFSNDFEVFEGKTYEIMN
jgi:hypothetical protein